MSQTQSVEQARRYLERYILALSVVMSTDLSGGMDHYDLVSLLIQPLEYKTRTISINVHHKVFIGNLLSIPFLDIGRTRQLYTKDGQTLPALTDPEPIFLKTDLH